LNAFTHESIDSFHTIAVNLPIGRYKATPHIK